MADMWKTRAPPTALDFDSIAEGTFTLPSTSSATSEATTPDPGSVSTVKSPRVTLNGTSEAAGSVSASKTASGLKDQKELTLQENLVLFVSRSVNFSRLHLVLGS